MVKKMGKDPIATGEDLSQPAEGGTGFLLWGWVVVTVLNLAMVIGALVLFGP